MPLSAESRQPRHRDGVASEVWRPTHGERDDVDPLISQALNRFDSRRPSHADVEAGLTEPRHERGKVRGSATDPGLKDLQDVERRLRDRRPAMLYR